MKFTDEQLLNMTDAELEKVMQQTITDRVKTKKENTHGQRAAMYSVTEYNKFFNSTVSKVDKRERQKIRRVRNRFVNNILFYSAKDMKSELQKEIKEFENFYTKVYVNSDFSIDSLANNNSDKRPVDRGDEK